MRQGQRRFENGAAAPGVSVVDGEEDPAAWAAFLDRLDRVGLESSRYQPVGEVARGAMGAIDQVFDENLRRNLAMKRMLERPDADRVGRLVGRRLLDADDVEVPAHDEVGALVRDHVAVAQLAIRGSDADQDLLSDAYEIQVGLDPASTTHAEWTRLATDLALEPTDSIVGLQRRIKDAAEAGMDAPSVEDEASFVDVDEVGRAGRHVLLVRRLAEAAAWRPSEGWLPSTTAVR